jgi:PAS domain S-box-containing protein
LDKLFENVQAAVVLARNDGTVIRANKEFLRLFGHFSTEFQNAHLLFDKNSFFQ